MASDPIAVQNVLDALRGLNVESRYVFHGDCLYCDAKPVGWIAAHHFYLKNTGKSIAGTERFPLENTVCKPRPSYVIPEASYKEPVFKRLVQETADRLPDKEKRW